MAKPRYKKLGDKMTPAEFTRYLNRTLDPCATASCRENAIVLVSYPSFDGRLRWCVCERCGTYHVKPELEQPRRITPPPSIPGSALAGNEDAIWFSSTTT